MKYIPPASLLLDAYKTGHHEMNPEGTECIAINMTPRSYKHALAKLSTPHYDGKMMHFSLQALIKTWLLEHWDETFFSRPWIEVRKEYKEVVDHALDTDLNIDNLHALHTLGYLPIEIRALPEGTFVPMRVPTFIVVPTHKDFSWLPGRLETLLSTEYWKPATVATISHNFRKVAEHYATICGSPAWFIDYQAHGFELRGMSGMWDGSTCSMGHLLSFLGSDTLPGAWLAKQLYEASFDRPLIKTARATEHSTMTLNGRDGQFGTYDRLITKYPTGILALVSDQYNLWEVLRDILPRLKEKIMARDGRLVIRPDSGNPCDIICGTALAVEDIDEDTLAGIWIGANTNTFVVRTMADDKFYTVTWNGETHLVEELSSDEVTDEMYGAYEILYQEFGGTRNTRGYIDLVNQIGLIYGDSIDPKMFAQICERLLAKRFSISNLVVGVGSYCYQFITRDTFGMAVKATFGIVNGEQRQVQKDPITGDGTKTSAIGMLAVRKDDLGELYLEDGLSFSLDDILRGNFDSGLLRPIFRNSELLVDEEWHDVRERVQAA